MHIIMYRYGNLMFKDKEAKDLAVALYKARWGLKVFERARACDLDSFIRALDKGNRIPEAGGVEQPLDLEFASALSLDDRGLTGVVSCYLDLHGRIVPYSIPFTIMDGGRVNIYNSCDDCGFLDIKKEKFCMALYRASDFD